ncbi:MAG: hypothetical protein JF589_11020 [Gemmatimonadetes bacterium]|nr:hypothetical protein [Gemmatimonadota bacterium]
MLSRSALVGAALCVVALACGDVPTLEGGIAFISPVILPSPAVAIDDTLRNEAGVVAPLRIVAVGTAGDTIENVEPTFIVTTVPGPSATILANNLVRGDSVRTASIIARVGTRLQTPPAQLSVVYQPDSMAAGSPTTANFPALSGGGTTSSVPLTVNVTSAASGTRSGVPSIIVRYLISTIYPTTTTVADTSVVLVDDQNRFVANGLVSVDTTDASGNASRSIRAVPFGFDSVAITVSANNLKGVPLAGGPIRFVVSTK